MKLIPIIICLLGIGTFSVAIAQESPAVTCPQQAFNDLGSCREEAASEGGDTLILCAEQFQARIEICDALGDEPYAPKVDPANFVDPTQIGDSVEPNPLLPLVVGRTWTYEGSEGEMIEVKVTEETKEIVGVTAIVVQDTVTEDGEVIEDTKDWFAQDKDGNVWYFGESTEEFEDGESVGTAGSWEAGVDGAQPGIVMKANPEVGDIYRQEYLPGEAEDMAEVLEVDASAEATAGSCDGTCLLTRDFTPLEPGINENKYYAPNIGLLLEVDPDSGERVELIEFQQ